MRFGPWSLSRRRTLRGVAGFVVAFLLAGQAMAVTGCCFVVPSKANDDAAATDIVCAEHAQSDASSGGDTKRNCPAEEATPQARSVDLPNVPAVAAISPVVFDRIDRLAYALVHTDDTNVPPPPLYARLQRLRL